MSSKVLNHRFDPNSSPIPKGHRKRHLLGSNSDASTFDEIPLWPSLHLQVVSENAQPIIIRDSSANDKI